MTYYGAAVMTSGADQGLGSFRGSKTVANRSKFGRLLRDGGNVVIDLCLLAS